MGGRNVSPVDVGHRPHFGTSFLADLALEEARVSMSPRAPTMTE
jgi:hypothetical protein